MVRLLAGLLLVLGLSGPAGAEEYRLQVASLYRDSFVHYFDGPLGTGSGELAMDRLERDLDTDRVPRGAMLGDRTFRYGWDAVAASFRAGKVIAEIRPAEGSRRWDEVVWQGVPGERSAWVIGSGSRDIGTATIREGPPAAAGESHIRAGPGNRTSGSRRGEDMGGLPDAAVPEATIEERAPSSPASSSSES